MSPNEGPKSGETVLDEAIRRLVRVQSDAATTDDWNALTAWIERSDTNASAFAAVELASATIDDNASEIASALAVLQAPPQARPAVRTEPRRLGWQGWATGAFLVAVSVVFVTANFVQTGHYRTGVGETREVRLDDGTRVHLDAASEMTSRLGWGSRRVSLAHAQASFDVAEDPRRPFIIAVGDQTVRVVGTEFNIRQADGTTVVTVRRGIVEVRQPSLGPDPVARLTAGQALSHLEGTPVSSTRMVESDKAFAWRAGRLICEDEPLSQVVAELNRRYRIPIRVSPAAATKHFSGVLTLGDQNALVSRLAAFLALTVRRTDREILLH